MSTSASEYIVRSAAAGAEAEPYDFARPRSFSDRQFETAEVAHDAFADRLADTLTAALGDPVEITCSSLDEVPAADFDGSRTHPTVLVGFELGGQGTAFALDLAPALALFLVERHLGGTGPLTPDARALSELERAVIEEHWLPAIGIAFAEAWGTIPPRSFGLAPRLNGLNLVEPGARVIAADVDVTIGEGTARLALCYPADTLRLLLDVSATHQATRDREHRRPAVLPNDLPIDLRAELGRTRLSVGDLLRLAPGDVIPLSQPTDAPMPVWVGDHLRFEARTGVRGKRLALQVLTPPASPPTDEH